MDFQKRCDDMFSLIAVGGMKLNGAPDHSLEGEQGADEEAKRKQTTTLRRLLRTWRHGPVLSWKLSANEFRTGVRALAYLPPVTLTRVGFKKIVDAGGYTDETGCVSVDGFRRLMRDQLFREMMNRLERAIRVGERGSAMTGPWCAP